MIPLQELYTLAVVLSGLIGIYIKVTNDVTKINSRVHTLEQSRGEISEMLKKLSDDIHEIKILLARKQIDK